MNEEIKALLAEFIAKLNELEAESTADDAAIGAAVSPVAAYVTKLHEDLEAYYLNADSEVTDHVLCDADINECSNKYQYYLSEYYAKQACRMKLINDMMLAFKWCHDVDNQWVTGGTNYTVVYDCQLGKFIAKQHKQQRMFNTVYFSNLETAQQCAEWLGLELAEMCPETWR